MYRMSNSEFMQYESAERRLQELHIQHAYELQQAYDGIHPTISCFDYEEGSIHSESINPADYAIYLIELKEEHQRQQRWWKLRAEAYQEALKKLNSDEQKGLTSVTSYKKREEIRKRLREVLTEIVDTRPDLKRQSIPLDDIEDMEAADRQIEKMSLKELLTDYWDLDEHLNEEYLKKQCIYLYRSCDWPYKEIGKQLGIPTSRVKKYVNSIEIVQPINAESQNTPIISKVEVTYLPPQELEEYRTGKKGGSKWCSYDDYLQMKAKGMSRKEIAEVLGIESNELSYRIRAWKTSGMKRQNIRY